MRRVALPLIAGGLLGLLSGLQQDAPATELAFRASILALLALLVSELRALTWWWFHWGVDTLAEQDARRHDALIARLERQESRADHGSPGTPDESLSAGADHLHEDR